MTDQDARIAELERENADLQRQNRELREAIEALLAPAPVNDKERLWLRHHWREAYR